MTLGERIKTILAECGLKQVDFAAALGVSANYVNQLVNGKKETLSGTLAKLIEELYGYPARWVLTGEGEKAPRASFSAAKAELLKKVSQMPQDEILALFAFAGALESVKKRFPPQNP